ncbi:YbaN family protein [Pseudidiomarina mangrovi]|uniref:YbaN family protein n=1 Tax=Pseudidiomarina mangrovi TaxID=2487133 RepID=UPI000FC9963E|nr:YbaN family protein [Pseudidiomarina mangrovi]
MTELLRIVVWRTVAIIFLLLALIGIALPVMPTVPFLLVAAWAGGKGWPVLEQKLLAHPTYGPQIQQWRDHGVVRRTPKVITTLMMAGSWVILSFSPIALWLKFTVIGIMATILLWLWLRPEQIPAATSND